MQAVKKFLKTALRNNQITINFFAVQKIGPFSILIIKKWSTFQDTGNFLGLGEYDDENLNDDVLLPELINKPCCGTSTSSTGVTDLTNASSDLVSVMKNKPVVKPIDSNDSGMSSNPSGSEESGKQVLFKQVVTIVQYATRKYPLQ